MKFCNNYKVLVIIMPGPTVSAMGNATCWNIVRKGIPCMDLEKWIALCFLRLTRFLKIQRRFLILHVGSRIRTLEMKSSFIQVLFPSPAVRSLSCHHRKHNGLQNHTSSKKYTRDLVEKR